MPGAGRGAAAPEQYIVNGTNYGNYENYIKAAQSEAAAANEQRRQEGLARQQAAESAAGYQSTTYSSSNASWDRTASAPSGGSLFGSSGGGGTTPNTPVSNAGALDGLIGAGVAGTGTNPQEVHKNNAEAAQNSGVDLSGLNGYNPTAGMMGPAAMQLRQQLSTRSLPSSMSALAGLAKAY